jgi:hypothetical protein
VPTAATVEAVVSARAASTVQAAMTIVTGCASRAAVARDAGMSGNAARPRNDTGGRHVTGRAMTGRRLREHDSAATHQQDGVRCPGY